MGRKPANKKRSTDDERKSELVLTLSPHFGKRGIKSFSMDDMAEVIGISKATLYKYFSSREEIVSLFITKKLEQGQGFVTLLNDEQYTYVERYTKALEYFLPTVADTTALFLSDLLELYPSIWHLIDHFREYSIKALEEYYQVGIDQGIFRPIHTAILTSADEHAFTAFTDPKFLKKNKITLAEALTEYFDMRMGGIVNPAPL